MRHVLWQGSITTYVGEDIAKRIGDLHESDANLIDKYPNAELAGFSDDEAKRQIADSYVDLKNNILARSLGRRINGNASYLDFALFVLKDFYDNGFWTYEAHQDGRFYPVKKKLTKEQYNQASSKVKNYINSQTGNGACGDNPFRNPWTVYP